MTRMRWAVPGSRRSRPGRIPSFAATRSDRSLAGWMIETSRSRRSARHAQATLARAASVAKPLPHHAAASLQPT